MPTVEERLSVLERDNIETKRRMSELGGQFEFISGQLRTVQTCMHNQFEQVDRRFDKVEARLDRLEGEVKGLREDMPGIVADAVREVLRERRQD